MIAVKRVATGLVLLVFGLAGQALAVDRPPPPRPSVIVQPDILEPPPYETMLAFYPKQAWNEGLEARSKVLCDLSAKGEVSNCQPKADTAPGQGFSDASVEFATLIKMRPKTVDGVAVPSQVIIPLYWSMLYDEHPMAFSAPSPAALLAAYPAAARAARRDGKATLECRLVSRHLTDCRVVAETDPADGFGTVALAMAPSFVMRSCVRPKRGVETVEPVRVTFYWWSPRADGVEAGPEHAALGYGNRFKSVITGEVVDRSRC